MKLPFLLIFELLLVLSRINYIFGVSVVPVISLDPKMRLSSNQTRDEPLQYLPFIMLIDINKDTSEYWRETEILELVRNSEINIDYERCERSSPSNQLVHFPSRRTVRPICRNRIELAVKPPVSIPCFCDHYTMRFKVKNRTYAHIHNCPCFKKRQNIRTTKKRKNKMFVPRESWDLRKTASNEDKYYQLCPQCPHFNNFSECELFRDSCKERKVLQSEYRTYCDRKYGKWRTMFIPADYTKCRCCDECIFYRELDQSCMQDDYSFDAEEFLPVTTIDFRAGCNPYWGHPEQEMRALRCDKILRRCVPVTIPPLPNETLQTRRNFRYEPTTGGRDCPTSCRGFPCHNGQTNEEHCTPGAFLPDKDQCNCCGRCSTFQQLNEKCAEFKKTVHNVNGTREIEVEEEFMEPGCDDGLVCRQGRCQDIHNVETITGSRRKRDEGELSANEPCKREMKIFKKKYGADGHLHYDAPQCTPLWLYAPVQCRRFVCYCSLEDGSFILGIKVPRVEVSNMNCDCAREKCRTGSDVECDGYGNYKEAQFTPHVDDWGQERAQENEEIETTPGDAPQRTSLDAFVLPESQAV